MQLIMFSKTLQDKTLRQLVDYAQRLGIDGYDLAVREGHAVNPENAATELPKLMKLMRTAGLTVPMVSTATNLTQTDHPAVRPLLKAMADSSVPLLKIGYFTFDPTAHDYRTEVTRVRAAFGRWELLAREYQLKICYHTHSNRNMGLNAGSLAHLLAERDPRSFGAYLDTAHLRIEGEEFDLAVAMLKEHLSIVSLKDVMLTRQQKNDHGSSQRRIVEAGEGMVDWTLVFATLRGARFDGPLSVHCEFEAEAAQFEAAGAREVAFFRRYVASAEA